jgi:hypothetical protein
MMDRRYTVSVCDLSAISENSLSVRTSFKFTLNIEQTNM